MQCMTRSKREPPRRQSPVSPGEVLQAEFLEPLGLSEAELAQALAVNTELVHRVVAVREPLTAEMALRLGRFFGTSAEFWMNLQSRFELERARDEQGSRIEQDVVPMTAAT
jgi:addiction module HigA family antidote